jgi:MOSC domain-containing protein YiiM
MKEPSTEGNGRSGRLVAINRSGGGVPKLPISEALITEAGVEGDRQQNTKIHGGPDRAVSLYSLEAIRALAREGNPVEAGTMGENLTVSGLDWSLVVPGCNLTVGPVRLHITKFAKPCSNIRGAFANGDASRISPDLHPGWSRVCARVVESGVVRVGDSVVLL